MYVTAIITAGGKGKRVRGKIPKQYIKIGGKPLICYTLSVFCKSSEIDNVILVAAPDRVKYCKRLIKQYYLNKVLQVVSGANTRARSVYNGLRSVPAGTDIVVVHDAARPFITADLIYKAAISAKRWGAVVTAVSPKDTVKEVSKGYARKILRRDRIMNIQTPQAFRYSILQDSYKKYKGRFKDASDSSFIVEQAGYKVRFIEGDYRNIKITDNYDLELARSIIQSHDNNVRIGLGYDIHKLIKGRPLIIGGVKIPSSLGLSGHSDADVLLHALTDALFGAAGERDLGWHFPDTDPKYKGRESSHFLLYANKLLQKRGYSIVNIDTVIIAQSPRLQPYYRKMTNNICMWLNLPKNKVTVKYCSPEQIGTLGNKKAIASIAVVALGKQVGK